MLPRNGSQSWMITRGCCSRGARSAQAAPLRRDLPSRLPAVGHARLLDEALRLAAAAQHYGVPTDAEDEGPD